jgi:hypothetical protein
VTDVSLVRLVRLEWRHGSSRSAIVITLGGLLGLVASHLILSLVPVRVITFMQLGFLLEDFGSVLLLNDLLAAYLCTFLLGITEALSVVIVAREEHGLELLLTKPVSTADFVTARSVPVLLRMLVTGVGISLGCGLITALHPGVEHDAVSAGGALGGGLVLTALALVLVALLMISFVRLREPFHALLLASFIWLSTTMPAAVLLYRPDVFDGKPALREAIVLATVVWNEATLAWLGWVALLAALPLALGLVRVSGYVLARMDDLA